MDRGAVGKRIDKLFTMFVFLPLFVALIAFGPLALAAFLLHAPIDPLRTAGCVIVGMEGFLIVVYAFRTLVRALGTTLPGSDPIAAEPTPKSLREEQIRHESCAEIPPEERDAYRASERFLFLRFYVPSLALGLPLLALILLLAPAAWRAGLLIATLAWFTGLSIVRWRIKPALREGTRVSAHLIARRRLRVRQMLDKASDERIAARRARDNW